MAISEKLQFATLDELYLDAQNPRLGRQNANANLSQDKILGIMRDFVLDELAVSYLESGFWTHEALLVVKEKVEGEQRLVVVEGNRRLAALKYLHRAFEGDNVPTKWHSIVEGEDYPNKLFSKIPYLLVDSRQEIEAFLGFRHVTGIKQWEPEEKAQFIAKLIDEQGMSYEQVMRRIGSITRTVRENYISYHVLLQMESDLEDFAPEYVEDRFSVMFLTLQKKGVQNYLNINISADPNSAVKPVPETHLKNLAHFALWLFGNRKQPPLFRDSRLKDDFSTILENPEAVKYLESHERPDFDYAFQLARDDERQLIRLINEARINIRISLSHVHYYKDSPELQSAVERLGTDFKELINRFPNLCNEILKDD